MQAGGAGTYSGPLPQSLVFPFRTAFAPRLGVGVAAAEVKQTVVRAGFGMNYTDGQYATFATDHGAPAAWCSDPSNW